MKTSKDYYTTHLVTFEEFPCRSYTSLEVLSFLNGKPWDDLALGYIHSLRPTSIRVTKGGCKLDARTWRVTVFIDDENIITKITQEVEVGLPDGVRNGLAMDHALKYGLDSEQVKWHVGAIGYVMDSSGFFKKDENGKLVKFPKG